MLVCVRGVLVDVLEGMSDDVLEDVLVGGVRGCVSRFVRSV